MTGRTINTIISEKSSFKGNLVLKHSIEISGYFEGKIETEEDIIVTETGQIKTDIRARNVHLDGEIQGNIHATYSVFIGSKAKVKGNIKSPNLTIEDGAVTYGRVAIDKVDSKNSKHQDAEE